MKRTLTVIAIASVLAACSNVKSTNPIAEQKLSTNFVSEQIKIESKCDYFGFGSECQIVAIEATGTAPSYGNTVNNRKTALIRAEMNAKAQVSEFLNNEITTSRVNTTIAKNIEKATDKVNNGKADGETVEMTDQEAKNVSLRENSNQTVSTMTETIKSTSTAVLRGFRKISEKVVGEQEVAVTIRWDVQSNNSRTQLLKAMQ
jgi:hypothetical protein